jgi:catechol 2,3-dioxygenase-like lactoylglutathione lyase family enzyme
LPAMSHSIGRQSRLAAPTTDLTGKVTFTEGMSAQALLVRCIEQTAVFYGLKLGFAVIFPAPASEASLIVICRDGEQLCFREGADSILDDGLDGAPRRKVSISVPDVDALAADFVAHGVSLISRPSNKADGVRSFEVVDPDCHILLFAQGLQGRSDRQGARASGESHDLDQGLVLPPNSSPLPRDVSFSNSKLTRARSVWPARKRWF